VKVTFNTLASTVLAAAAVLGACSDSGGDGDTSEAGTGLGTSSCFIAYDSTFTGFTQWASHAYDAPVSIGGNIHFAGPRVEYINNLPEAGATEFPVGTIIVKAIDGIDADSHHIFAMVKRGCDYNAAGAPNWEWYELQDNGGGAYSIIWSGPSAPPGETYADAGNASCNSCHTTCADNDYVCSPDVQLFHE
jgi:hypothetical protein